MIGVPHPLEVIFAIRLGRSILSVGVSHLLNELIRIAPCWFKLSCFGLVAYLPWLHEPVAKVKKSVVIP